MAVPAATTAHGSVGLANNGQPEAVPLALRGHEQIRVHESGTCGMHYFLGAHLARVELSEALRVVTAKMSNPRRTGPTPWQPITELSGPTTLSHRVRGATAQLRHVGRIVL